MKRRRLIISTSVISLIALLGVLAQGRRAFLENRAVEALRKSGATVTFDYESKGSEKPSVVRDWLKPLLGDGVFGDVNTVMFMYTSPATDANVAPLSDLPNLRFVLLSGVGVTNQTAKRLSRIATLEGVNFNNTSVTASGLREMSRCEQLQSLSLMGTTIDDECLQALMQWPNLKHLQVARGRISADGLESIGSMQTLRGIDLFEAGKVEDEGLAHLERLTELESLHVINAPITDSGLRSCAEWRSLRFLRINSPQITDEGIKHLQGLDQLEFVGFTHSAIEDPVTLAELPNLRDLDLSSSGISDAGVASLSKSNSITGLRLLWTELTDASMKHLASLRTLQRLEIGPHVTESSAQTLHDALPSCTIQLIDTNGGYGLTLKAGKPSSDQLNHSSAVGDENPPSDHGP